MDLFWEKDGWQNFDKHLTSLKKSPFCRQFPELDLSRGPALYLIRGPRQVGKSTWLKKILSSYPDPKKVFYQSCETIENYQELSVLLKSIKSHRSLILLDEVSFVKNWSRAVKHEIDSGYNGVIIITGSHAVDLRQGADLMPGRFGYGKELTLRPMTFEEFLYCRNEAGWITKSRYESIQLYFKIGGMPAAVAESGQTGNIPNESLDTYERWIIGDALKFGKNKAFMEGLLSQLALCMTTPVSLQTLAKKTEIASHHTVQEYIQFLEDSFAIRTCYSLDPDSGASKFRKQKKFYFTDPIIFWIALRMGGLPVQTDLEPLIAEMVGYETLARISEAKKTRLGYFSNQYGEVDYFSPKRFAIELKWSEAATNISKAFYKCPVAEKTIWTKNNFLIDMPSNIN